MRFIFCVLLLLCFGKLSASNYYFSSVGDDNRSPSEAQHSNTPWRTINKLNDFSSNLNPGDTIFFKANEIFDGAIQMQQSGSINSPIVFTSFGSGSQPVINGFTILKDWTAVGGNIWEANLSSVSMVNMLLENGKFKPIGRYPNTTASNNGYLNIKSFSGNTQITADQLNGNWSGAEVVIRKNRWVLDRNVINSQYGNTINYNSQSPYNASSNYGFFIQNHPATLDMEGEWYYHINEKKLGIYYPSGDPSSALFEVSNISTLVTINNQGNLVFNNLSFRGANASAFVLNNAYHVTISNCAISYSGINAINITNSNNVQILNSTIDYSNNIAINLVSSSDCIIKNDIITNTGSAAGMGQGDSGSYEAIMLTGDNNVIEQNEVDNTGYIPVTFRGNNNFIKNNFINNFAFVKDDAGGIYTWNNIPNAPLTYGTKITDNIIINGIGASAGTDNAGYLPANGIYLDDNTANAEISGNTVAQCALNGLYLHNAHEITVTRNTIYDNGSQLVISHDGNAAYSAVRNIILKNNIFFSKQASQNVALFQTPGNDIGSFGYFDSNYYSRPLNNTFIISLAYSLNGSSINNTVTLDQWKALYGKDNASTTSPVSLNSSDQIRFEYNSGMVSKNVPLDQTYIDVRKKTYSGTLNLDPYSSVILMKQIASAPSTSACGATGSILREEWDNVQGNDVAQIPINTAATSSAQINSLETNDVGNNYGARIRGYICPPQTGNYTFYISGDDAAELWLSTNDDPSNKVKIANFLSWTNYQQFNKFSSQKSASINLQSGKKYYIEVLHKQGGGGNSVTVAWKLPDGSMEVPIAGSRLSPFTDATPVAQGCSATGSILREQWDNVQGNDIVQIPLNIQPSASARINVLETKDMGNYYGARIRGYLCPPQTGNYIFFVSGDDAVELWLSMDDNASAKVKLAYAPAWTAYQDFNKFSSQTSTEVYLEAGHKYYIEVLHKQGNGANNMTVGWKMPDGNLEVPIAGNRLSPFIPLGVTTCTATGNILREVWDNIDGNDVAQIPVSTIPAGNSIITALETKDMGDNYGERIRGYLCPPQSGSYTFFISGDDAAELWLSNNDNPSYKVKIAELPAWTSFHEFNKYPSQQSAAVYLTAGNSNYIEVLHKQGNGPNNVTVGWQLPDQSQEIPIAGNRLSPYLVSNNTYGIKQNSLLDNIITENTSRQPGIISFPNPFIDNATLIVTPAVTGITKVDLYNLQGSLIKRIYNGNMLKDTNYTFKLKRDNLLNGIYIVRMVTASGTTNKKITLAK